MNLKFLGEFKLKKTLKILGWLITIN